MIKHELRIDDNNLFRIEWEYLGRERYFLNNELIDKRVSIGLSGERLFEININKKTRKLKLIINTKPGFWNVNDMVAKAYLDDRLIEDDILKIFKGKWNKYNKVLKVFLIVSILFSMTVFTYIWLISP